MNNNIANLYSNNDLVHRDLSVRLSATLSFSLQGMTAVVVVAAAVPLVCAVHAVAAIPHHPTTYRPFWSTVTHSSLPVAATQPAGCRQPFIREQPLGPSRRGPILTASSGAASHLKRAVLREEVYQGENRLVYKLVPGTIFAGVRIPRLPEHHDGRHQDLRDAGLSKPPKKYSGRQEDKPKKEAKLIHKPPGGAVAGWTQTHPDAQSHKQPQPAPRRPPRRWTPLANIRSHLASWTTAGIGALRSVRLIVMILQYLGFIPHLPGLPKYEDPDYRRPSTKYTLDKGKAGDL